MNQERNLTVTRKGRGEAPGLDVETDPRGSLAEAEAWAGVARESDQRCQELDAEKEVLQRQQQSGE